MYVLQSQEYYARLTRQVRLHNIDFRVLRWVTDTANTRLTFASLGLHVAQVIGRLKIRPTTKFENPLSRRQFVVAYQHTKHLDISIIHLGILLTVQRFLPHMVTAVEAKPVGEFLQPSERNVVQIKPAGLANSQYLTQTLNYKPQTYKPKCTYFKIT